MLLPVLVGPTASGKTALATALARLVPVEIVSADSRQIYRGLDIGTAKPTATERAAAAYHGLDLVPPDVRYSAGRFAREAAEWIEGIMERGRVPLVVGGTGFYVRALFDGLFEEPPLDPTRRRRLAALLATLSREDLARWAARLDSGFRSGGSQRAARAIEVALLVGRRLSTLHRAAGDRVSALTPWYAVLTLERAVLAARIAARTQAMLAAGLVEEVRVLLDSGIPPSAPGLSAVGYRETVLHLQGRLEAARLAEAIARATRRYAKRQDTWFRHQMRGEIVRLGGAEAPETLARAVLAGYRAAAR